MRVRVTVYPRREILDPQGKAIRKALHRLGFDEVTEVRAGKSFELELSAADPGEARARLDQMSKQLLSNPIVEDYELEAGFEPNSEKGE